MMLRGTGMIFAYQMDQDHRPPLKNVWHSMPHPPPLPPPRDGQHTEHHRDEKTENITSPRYGSQQMYMRVLNTCTLQKLQHLQFQTIQPKIVSSTTTHAVWESREQLITSTRIWEGGAP